MTRHQAILLASNLFDGHIEISLWLRRFSTVKFTVLFLRTWECFLFFFSVLLLVRRKKNDASGRIINRLCNIANFVYIDNFYVAHIYTCAMVFLSGKSMPVFRACGEVYHIDFSSLRGRLPF